MPGKEKYEKEIQKAARELANLTGNDSLNDPESIGFIRFMIYSCMFFAATKQCTIMKCEDCKATKLIDQHILKYPAMKPIYDQLQQIKRTK